MYVADERDRVERLIDIPQCSVGAPNPIVLAGQGVLLVVYLLEDEPNDLNDLSTQRVSPARYGEPAARVRFHRPYASMFGPPNDEAFGGHPLAARGLEPYGAYEIKNSSWIRALEKMNRVHAHHSPEIFSDYRHFVLAFHDNTFECVAAGYEFEVANRLAGELVAHEAAKLT